MQWLQPKRVMHQPDDGISSLAAGAFSTAAITGAGELYLWGTLLTENASAALLKQSGGCLAWPVGTAGAEGKEQGRAAAVLRVHSSGILAGG